MNRYIQVQESRFCSIFVDSLCEYDVICGLTEIFGIQKVFYKDREVAAQLVRDNEQHKKLTLNFIEYFIQEYKTVFSNYFHNLKVNKRYDTKEKIRNDRREFEKSYSVFEQEKMNQLKVIVEASYQYLLNKYKKNLHKAMNNSNKQRQNGEEK